MEHILCLDIGSGTQDVLLYRSEMAIENCPKFILPSPARVVGGRIRKLTDEKRPIYLYGRNMGGGFGRAVAAHIKAGLSVAAHHDAALGLGDDPERVRAMGVDLIDDCPRGYVPVYLTDYDPEFWRAFLAVAGLSYPDQIMVAAQDHGYHPGQSNRIGRFKLWERFLHDADGQPAALVYDKPPQELTRLAAIRASVGNGLFCDTGSAAALGALWDPAILNATNKQGGLLINVGNGHILGMLIYREKVWGVYEHHNGLIEAEALIADLERFRRGELTFAEVFDKGGHGCLTMPFPTEARGFPLTYVLGPCRAMLSGLNAEFPAPGGDMMLAGCFGLLRGMRYFNARLGAED